MNSFRKALFVTVTATAAMLSAASAQATTTINVTKITQDAGSESGTIGYDAPAKSIWDLFKPDMTVDTAAGRFAITAKDAANAIVNYQGYCVDIFQNLGTGSFSVTSVASLLSNYDSATAATKANQLNALIANGNALVTNSVSSAAMQLAVWEVVYDYNSLNAYSLKDGEFYSSNMDGARDLANTYLNNVTSGAWKANGNYTLSVLSSDKVQDLLVFTQSAPSAVPEPATWAMMLVGFGTVGGALRRRRNGALGVAHLG